MERRKDKRKFLHIIQKANVDPQNHFKRECIISQIDRASRLEILDMKDFNPEESLGSGFFSDVCLLARKKDGKKFAGKFIKGDISSKEFINEATILKSCSTACATIVNLVGIITTPKCLVLELHVNGSLDKAFKNDNLNVERGRETEFPFLRRLNYIRDMCRAVNHLHRENICHRDIAMRNLLLSDDKKHVILTDFSLSRVVRSAIQRQATLTDLVPKKSAPETIRKSSSSKFGPGNWETWYSLKSDIWSLGVTMFEIIDKAELRDIKDSKDMPRSFSTEWLPSTWVFNRMQDLWILILRCLNERPEDRPQSWHIQEQIEMLIVDPWNIGNENDDYIRAPFKGITRVESTVDDQSTASYYSPAGMPIDGSWINTVYEVELCPSSESLWSESPTSPKLRKHESLRDVMPIVIKEFFRKISSYVRRRDLKATGNSGKLHLSTKQKRFGSFHKHPLLPSKAPSSSRHILGQHLRPKQLQNLNLPFRRNKSDPYFSTSNLLKDKGLNFLKTIKSVSSFLGSSLTFQNEDSVISDKVQFCSPLSVSLKSTATNIRYCKDRGFFESIATNFIEEQKPNSPEYLFAPNTPESEWADELTPASVLSDNPRLSIVL